MDIQNAKELAAVVRKLRQDQRMTQAALAQAAGVGREWIIHLEKGRTTLELGMVLRTLRTLGVGLRIEPVSAATTGIDLNRLFEDTDSTPKP